MQPQPGARPAPVSGAGRGECGDIAPPRHTPSHPHPAPFSPPPPLQPEIDIFEASAAYTPEGTPFAASSLQYAPGVSKDRPAGPDPVSEGQTWYKGLRYGNTTKPNQSYYGRLASDPKDPAAWYVDSVSAETDLPEAAWLEEGAVFRVEWEPGPGGLIEWYVERALRCCCCYSY